MLHLTLQNNADPGPFKVQIDYLAPGLSWKSDYAMQLDRPEGNVAPARMQVESWLTVQNDTGTDLCADVVDLVAGEIKLLSHGGSTRTFTANAQISTFTGAAPTPTETAPQVTGISVFSRIRLGGDLSFAANASTSRFPFIQRHPLPVEERYIFENEHSAQTLGRGGFMPAPRNLDVRLVSRNQFSTFLPTGDVTLYSQDQQVPQVVGQDQIPLTPVGADFSLTQGRSNSVQGTRRILDRKTVPDPAAPNRTKVVTQVEVVITNHGSRPITAFVREGVETYTRDRSVTETTHSHQNLGDRMIEFRLPVPANAPVTPPLPQLLQLRPAFHQHRHLEELPFRKRQILPISLRTLQHHEPRQFSCRNGPGGTPRTRTNGITRPGEFSIQPPNPP